MKVAGEVRLLPMLLTKQRPERANTMGHTVRPDGTIQVHTIESLFDSDKEADNRKVILHSELKHKAKIVVEIKGGALQAVYVPPALANIPVVLLDYDNFDGAGQPKTTEEQKAEAEIEQGKLKSIF